MIQRHLVWRHEKATDMTERVVPGNDRSAVDLFDARGTALPCSAPSPTLLHLEGIGLLPGTILGNALLPVGWIGVHALLMAFLHLRFVLFCGRSARVRLGVFAFRCLHGFWMCLIPTLLCSFAFRRVLFAPQFPQTFFLSFPRLKGGIGCTQKRCLGCADAVPAGPAGMAMVIGTQRFAFSACFAGLFLRLRRTCRTFCGCRFSPYLLAACVALVRTVATAIGFGFALTKLVDGLFLLAIVTDTGIHWGLHSGMRDASGSLWEMATET